MLWSPGSSALEAPVAAQLARSDRESAAATWTRSSTATGSRPGRAEQVARRRVGWSPARKNGRPWVWSQCRWPSRIAPRNGARRAPGHDARSPVPASRTSVGALTVVRERARTTCCRRTRANSGPVAGVEPRTPQMYDAHVGGCSATSRRCSSRRWLWLTSASAAGSSSSARGDRHLARCHGAEGGRARPALEDGPLAERWRPGRARRRARRRLDREDAVEQEEELVAVLALLGEQLAPLQLADLRLLAAAA